MGFDNELSVQPSEHEIALRRCLARLRRAPLDFRLRVQAGGLLVRLGRTDKALRVLRSCADYFTLAGFPLRALWALKLLEQSGAPDAVLDRAYKLLTRQYAHSEGVEWGDPIFEMPLPKLGELALSELPESLDEVVAEVERRGTDILRGTSFPDNLPRLPLLSDLEPEVFITVARSMRLQSFIDSELLMEEGAPGSGVFLIVTGKARVLKRREAIDAELAILSEGDVLGEMALVTRSPRVATVVADGEVTAFEIPVEVLDALGPKADVLQAVLSRQVCDRMVANLMRLSPVFRVLPADRRGELMARFTSRLVAPEEDIIVEGEAGRGLYIILDGLVQVTAHKSGERHRLSLLQEGDLFGEISLIRNSPATATCTALRQTMVMFLARADFQKFTQDYPQVAEKINELGDFRLLDNIYSLA